MDVRVGLWRKLSAEELMLLNCGIGEDSWESLRLKGGPTSPFKGDRSWVFFGRNDAKAETPVLWPPHAKSWLIGEDSDAERDWGQEEKGTTEDEMAEWHHWLDGHESEWTLGAGDGQGGLACCDSWGLKESDMTEWLNWTELKYYFRDALPQSAPDIWFICWGLFRCYVTVDEVVHGALTLLKNPKFTILNPSLKPHEIHLLPSAVLVRDPGSRPEGGGRWLLRFGSRCLWQASRKDVRTRIWLPLWPLAHMSLNLAMTLLGFGFCPSQHCHSFNKHPLSTVYMPFVVVVQLLRHVWLFVTPWTIQHARLPRPSLCPWVCSDSC